MSSHRRIELRDLERELDQLIRPAEHDDPFRRELRSRLLAQARRRPARDLVRSRRRRPARPGVIAAGGLVTAAVATASAVLVLGGADSQDAFAGWNATPTRTPVGQVSAGEAKCAARVAEASSSSRGSKRGVGVDVSSEVLLTDTRGPYTLVLYNQVLCLSGPDFVSLSGRRLTDGVAVSTVDREPGEPYTIAQGPAAPGVSAVQLVLDSGSGVQATVSKSGFLAWWPSASRPTSITVTGSSGTRTEPLPYPRSPPAMGKARVQPPS